MPKTALAVLRPLLGRGVSFARPPVAPPLRISVSTSSAGVDACFPDRSLVGKDGLGRYSESRSTRSFNSTASASHGGKGRPKSGEGIKLTFKRSTGEIVKTVEANEGDDIVDVSWEYDLDIEAACEKSIACSTCHVILEPDVYDALEEPSDDENDMLDMAFGLTDTSRLGCQIKVTRDMDGTTITLPSATRNMRVDGSKPTPH